jgi:predicted methyltransferase
VLANPGHDGVVIRPSITLLLAFALAAGGCSAPAHGDDPASRASYDRYRRPERVVAALGLSPGQRVADVGAGSGYLTFRLAAAVGPTGRVVATDIDAAALDVVRARARAEAGRADQAPVVAREVTPSDPGLEPGAYDLVLLAEVDQYLPDRADYLARLRAALAPGGRIAVSNRHLYRAPLLAAATQAGLTIASEATDLPAHFLIVFRPAR